MKLMSLHLRNFRQHADTKISLPTGLIGLVGQNESGKSSILEGCMWALYGSRALRGTKAGVRWNRAIARHSAAVTLEFEIGGKTYVVERSESGARLYAGGMPIADGTSAVDAYMPQLLGMGLEEFSSTFLCKQRDLGRLQALGPTERRQFVLRLMGLDRIDDALRSCRQRKNDLQRELAGLQAGLGERAPLAEEAARAGSAVAQLESAAADAAQLVELRQLACRHAAAVLEASEQIRVRHETLTRSADQHRIERGGLEREIARLRAELAPLASLPAKIASAEQGTEKLPAMREELRQLHAARDRVRDRERFEASLADRQRGFDEARDHIRDAQFQIDHFDAPAYAKAREELAAAEVMWEDARSSRETSHAALVAQVEAEKKAAELAQRRLDALTLEGSAGACPTCQRALGAQLGDVLQQLRDDRDQAAERAEGFHHAALALAKPGDDEDLLGDRMMKLRAQVEAGRIAHSDAMKARDVIARWLPVEATAGDELTKLEAQIEALESASYDGAAAAEMEVEMELVAALEQQLVRDRAAAARIPALERAIESTRDGLAKVERRLAEVAEGIEGLAFDPAQHAQATAGETDARQQLEAARIRAAHADAAADAGRSNAARAAAALESYDVRASNVGKVVADLRIHAATAERLDAFRVQQASLIRPELEELTTGFVHLLTDGRHDAVTIGEDFDVTLHESGLAAEVVSGGTEDIAAIALRLAISQMVAQRAGQQLSLLVLDEPFGSLDEVRRANVLNLIRRLGRTFEQVLVISHVAETKDAVDYVIEVSYDESTGSSSVTQSRLPAPSPEEAMVAA